METAFLYFLNQFCVAFISQHLHMYAVSHLVSYMAIFPHLIFPLCMANGDDVMSAEFYFTAIGLCGMNGIEPFF